MAHASTAPNIASIKRPVQVPVSVHRSARIPVSVPLLLKPLLRGDESIL